MEQLQADVVIVGAGPGGATTAAHLARAGQDVVLLEKTRFPREKVCGDGLTPRAVKQLQDLDVDVSESAGWLHNRGLRIVGGGHTLELDWPDLESFPNFGLVRPRADFDQLLARTAEAAGARLLEDSPATGPIRDAHTGRLMGVTFRTSDGELAEVRAPVVVAADGNSSRLSLSVGRTKRDDRPMGVAVRAYYRSPRDRDEYLESWLELWDGAHLLPGYGWIFGMGDGTCNIGLGILNTSDAFGKVDYKSLLAKWLDQTPQEWGFREENRVGEVRGAALPMGFNRQPHYSDGLMLVGDAGGMVNPFNGEGISYAMESGSLAAEVIGRALAQGSASGREAELHRYATALKQEYGGYYTLGRWFVELIGHPEVMRLATRHGLKRRRLMGLTLKLLANLTDPTGGDVTDRLIHALTKVAPAA